MYLKRPELYDFPGVRRERLETTLSHALESSGRTLKNAVRDIQTFFKTVEPPLALSGLLWVINKEIPLHQLDPLLSTIAVALLLPGSFNLGRRTKRILDAEMRGSDKIFYLSALFVNALTNFLTFALIPLTLTELSKPSRPWILANPITGPILLLIPEFVILHSTFTTHETLQDAGIIGKTKDQNR